MIMIMIFSVQSMCRVGENAHYSLGEEFFYSEHRPTGLSARILIDLTTEVAGKGQGIGREAIKVSGREIAAKQV